MASPVVTANPMREAPQPSLTLNPTTSHIPPHKLNRKWKSKNGERLRDSFGYRLRAAGVCARMDGGQLEVMLVSAQSGPHSWVIPGGGIELGEQYHEAVLREVEEEAGVRCDVIELMAEFKVSRLTQKTKHSDYYK